MFKSLISTLILAVSFVSTSSLTQVVAQKPRVNCSQATNTVEMKYCSQQSYQAADHQLNLAYQKVMSNISGEQKQLLITGQQSWINFRDHNCDFEVYGSRGGTGYEIFRNGCLERLTKQRTKDLQQYLSSQ